jgi:hypothetical protein
VAAHAAHARHLVTQLNLVELRLAMQWVDEMVSKQRFAHLRLVCTPSIKDPDALAAFRPDELAGWIRRNVLELPEQTLAELVTWVRRRVRMQSELRAVGG